MSADNVLQILPHRGLDQSLLLAILVGLLVLLVFTETLGWVFVGLVVPGYLSSVFIIEPTMGVTIVCEAIITYVLVRFLSDILARTTIWSPYFGRERFFLIVLVSIVVRQNSQIWLLPLTLGFIDRTFGTNLLFDVNEFSSIGLVLVPLVANMFWKINLRRGLYQISVPVLITYCVLAFVLLPYTNLSFSNIEITYDNVALNFLNTPKAYIILLVGSLLAARFNLLYGWDYNGILVPSLLSLGWLEPGSIVITVLEVLLLFGTTKLVLASPMLRTVNLEGPRQIALVFSLGFILKYIVAWVTSEYYPHVNVVDFFGYGYVVTSLLTVKMLQKKVIGRVLLPTLHVSLLAFVCGSLVGFGLEKLAPRTKPEVPMATEIPAATKTILRGPLGAMAVAAVRARSVPRPELAQGRPKDILQRYARLWSLIDQWLVDPSAERRREIGALAHSLDLSLRPLEGALQGRTAYVLMETEERLDRQTGWDTAVLVPGAPGPILEVPRPRTESPGAELAAVVCEPLRCRAILVSGIDSADGGDTAGDALAHPKASAFVAAENLRSAPIVQLRVSPRVPRATVRLHLHHKLPEQVKLDRLWPQKLALELELAWTAPPEHNQGWQRTDRLVLVLHPDAVWKVLLDYAERVAEAPPRRRGVSLKWWLRDTFGSSTTLGASQTVPSQSEVRFIGHLLASRLLDMRPERMRWLNHLARLIDYQIVELEDCVDDAGCWVLTERARPVKHRWGTLAVRADGAVEPLAIEAPRPLIEGGTWQIAVEMWRQSNSRILLVGHDLPAIHGMPRLDPVRYANVVTPFHAMHESVHRALRRDALVAPAPLIIQVRGFAAWRSIPEHVVIGLGPPALEERQTPAGLERVLAPEGFLGWLSDDTKFARGEPAYITLAGQGNPQLSFTHNTGGVDIALAWFSQPVRKLYMDESIEAATQRIESAGFSLTPRSAIGFLAEAVPFYGQGTARTAARFEDLVTLAERYAVTQDVAILRRLRRLAARDARIRVSASWSTEISVPFLALGMDGPKELHRAVILLSQFADDCTESPDSTGPSATRAARLSREELRAALIRRCRTISTRFPRRGP